MNRLKINIVVKKIKTGILGLKYASFVFVYYKIQKINCYNKTKIIIMSFKVTRAYHQIAIGIFIN